jgi:hypothetical protein
MSVCSVCGETNFGLAFCPACSHPYPEDDRADRVRDRGDDLDDLDDEEDEDLDADDDDDLDGDDDDEDDADDDVG